MLLFRWAMMLLLIAAGVSFAFYVGTGQARFQQGLVCSSSNGRSWPPATPTARPPLGVISHAAS
ncbi:MAG: hypothetical protein IPG16_01395 [Comamonadaceae bacterium]|nr:hypothetical protein [Comamonadaceae bacterium]